MRLTDNQHCDNTQIIFSSISKKSFDFSQKFIFRRVHNFDLQHFQVDLYIHTEFVIVMRSRLSTQKKNACDDKCESFDIIILQLITFYAYVCADHCLYTMYQSPDEE